MKNFRHKGDVLPWTNDTGNDVSSDDVVVMGNTIGVAVVDIPDTETGSVAIEGVYEVPKVSAAVFVTGEKLIYDVSAGEFDDSSATPATGDVTGGAVAAAPGADAETTALVKLTPGNTTVT